MFFAYQSFPYLAGLNFIWNTIHVYKRGYLEVLYKMKRAFNPGGDLNALFQREWEKCSRSNKRGVCLVCDLFHIITLSRNNR